MYFRIALILLQAPSLLLLVTLGPFLPVECIHLCHLTILGLTSLLQSLDKFLLKIVPLPEFPRKIFLLKIFLLALVSLHIQAH